MLVLGLVEIPWWGIIIISIICYLLYVSREFNLFKNQGVPGPMPIPIIGTAYTFLSEPLPYTELRYLKAYRYKGYYAEFLGSRPSLTVFDEGMLSEIMVKSFPTFPNRPNFKTGSRLFDSMLTSLDDAHWKYVRNEMSPTFTTGKLKMMNIEINRCADTLTDALVEQVTNGGEVEMEEYAEGYTMDVIASTAFGIRVNSQKDRNNEFVEKARRALAFSSTQPAIFMIVFFPGLTNILRKLGLTIEVFDKDIQSFFARISSQTIEMRKANNDQSRSDFVQLMIKAQNGENIRDGDEQKEQTKGKGITNDEILANAMLFFIAGYDTTSTSLSFFMYNMARYPDVQDKLLSEIEKVVGDQETISTTIVQEMPYLDQCVNENLRLYPPGLRVNRQAVQDTTINGIFIRKGAIINIPIYAIQHDEKKWPDPEKFDPERFSPENKRNRNPYHFLPFGNGPRNCIGMRLAIQELKVAIIKVLRKVKFSTCEKTQVPIIFDYNDLLLKVKGGIQLKMDLRS